MNYEYPVEVLAGSSFKLTLESRGQGESEFAILAASESNDFEKFPQLFSLPVLSHSLSSIGVYQLRVQVIHDHKVL